MEPIMLGKAETADIIKNLKQKWEGCNARKWLMDDAGNNRTDRGKEGSYLLWELRDEWRSV